MKLKRFLCKALPTATSNSSLSKDEINHARNVLRLKSGDLVEAMDGRGNAAVVRLNFSDVDTCFLELTEQDSTLQGGGIQVSSLILHLAVLKGDAMTWAIEKAVETGVSAIYPFLSERSVVQTKNRDSDHFRARWQKIADQSIKQCGRLIAMPVHPLSTLSTQLSTIRANSEEDPLVLHESHPQTEPLLEWLLNRHRSGKMGRPCHAFIGPEGGWTPAETEIFTSYGACFATLGELTLRAETAAVSVGTLFFAASTLDKSSAIS